MPEVPKKGAGRKKITPPRVPGKRGVMLISHAMGADHFFRELSSRLPDMELYRLNEYKKKMETVEEKLDILRQAIETRAKARESELAHESHSREQERIQIMTRKAVIENKLNGQLTKTGRANLDKELQNIQRRLLDLNMDPLAHTELSSSRIQELERRLDGEMASKLHVMRSIARALGFEAEIK
jgi:hypothetical protein